MFAEIIEVPRLKPGAALRKRRLTNLLSRIKIELFGVESLRPEFVEGKNVRELNTRLVEELIRRMLSTRFALIDTVYQPEAGELRFLILMKESNYDHLLCIHSMLSEYDLLDIAGRYPVYFDFIEPISTKVTIKPDLRIFNLRGDGKIHQAGKA